MPEVPADSEDSFPKFVEDDEKLYRRVQARRDNFKSSPDGSFRVSSQAFWDRTFQVSVDRARLIGGDATRTQWEATDAVVQLIAGTVRQERPQALEPLNQVR